MPAWLTAALQARGLLTEGVVATVRWHPLAARGWTAQMVRLSITYRAAAGELPTTLVAKLSAREAGTRAFFWRFYAREVAFYRRLVPEVLLRVPRCYYADYEAVTHAHVLLLEDVAPVAAEDILRGVGADVAAMYIPTCCRCCLPSSYASLRRSRAGMRSVTPGWRQSPRGSSQPYMRRQR